MEIDRNQIIEMFLIRDEVERAEQAERDLPEHIDPMAHAEALKALGIDPALLLTQQDNLEA
ncbi:MAG: hypothetical protein ACRDYA_19695 [Egibacteraceae bacterium]